MRQTFLLLAIFGHIFCSAQESPWGTGDITNQNIGILEDPSVITTSESGYGFLQYFPNAQQLLEDYNYDIYIPESYDGTEPYGLVTFINSGNNGGYKNQWKPVLDDEKLIWIAGDQIGNPIFIHIRMGVGMAAVHRMQEILNIDPERIYTSGNSGGARMAHNLAFIYPEIIKGTMPSCGGSYIRQVDQDYETQNPDGHYEAILSYPNDYLDYLLEFDQRYANMTSYNDFREGDIMNIYHNGSEVDGLKGKFLETTGNHCSTTTEHFRDALNFVEHPFLEVINEEFEEGTEIPFKTTNAQTINSNQLQLNHSGGEIAQIQSKDLFLWNDPKGAILKTSINIDSDNFNMNSRFHLGIWSMTEPSDYCGFEGNQLQEDLAAILLSVDFIGDQPTLNVQIENPAQPDLNQTLFTSEFTDWDISEPLAIKYHLWDQELRIELGAHLDTPGSIETGVRFLDDNRSIRIRWNEVANNYWNTDAWSNGAFLTLSSEKQNTDLDASNILVDRVELITADTDIETEIPNSYSNLSAAICMGGVLDFNGTLLTEEGVYESIFTNSIGCDSIVSLDLTVYPLPEVTISPIDAGIVSDVNDLAFYQWYFDGNLLEGENSSDIIPSESGEYYVEVTDANGCVNVSNTVNFIVSSLQQLEDLGIQVFPNPTNEILNIQGNGKAFEAHLYDLKGRLMQENLKEVNDLTNLSNGIYLLKIQIESAFAVVKIHKVDN